MSYKFERFETLVPGPGMVGIASDNASALVQLKAYLAQRDLPPNSRLPPERELSGMLGVSRGELRKALAVLEAEGRLWRHVGKGTFIGGAPAEPLRDLGEITNSTNPAEVMRARLLFEPELAREAALLSTAEDFRRMRLCLAQSRASDTWRQYENWDNQLHRTIAEATHNPTLLWLFDTLNAIRRAVVWGRLRADPMGPPESHHSFAEHEALVAAIESRDRDGAARAMRVHLQSVVTNLMETSSAAE